MRVTLLGSGEAVGVPAPLCDCDYCLQSERRRRPGLLIETDDATVVLDASPDIKEQLHRTGTATVDVVFLTHHHYDHVGGLHDLVHARMGFDTHVGIEDGYLNPDAFDEAEKPADPEFSVYMTATAQNHLGETNPHLGDTLDVRRIDHHNPVKVGDLHVVPFPVQHADSAFDTVGFAVSDGDAKIVYAPDMWAFENDPDEGDVAYTDADVLFAEGAALFRAFGHGEEADLRRALEAADADRTVLVNLNEHLQRMTTNELRTAAAEDGYELGSDFAEYSL